MSRVADLEAEACAKRHLDTQAGMPASYTEAVQKYVDQPGFLAYTKCIEGGEAYQDLMTEVKQRSPNAPAVNADVEPRPKGWRYFETRDGMRDEPVRWACSDSTNTLSLGFPYGTVKGQLCLRASKRFGKDVIFEIEKGQITGCAIDGCRVSVRFGDGPIESYSALPPSDHSRTTLFIRNYAGFLKKLRASQSVTVEALYFEAGYQSLTFNTAQLTWK